jgi:hypothetical protein
VLFRSKKTMVFDIIGVPVSPSLNMLNTYDISGLVGLQYSDNSHKQKDLVESSEKVINKIHFPFHHNTLNG